MKRFVCIILTFIMLISTGMCISAQQEAIDELSEYGIMVGDPDGNFRAGDDITRAEMVKIILASLGEENISQAQTEFYDVDESHWASGYIAEAYKRGIIDGLGGGIFNPDGKVTNEQVVKMIVCALGYGPRTQHKGGYPYGYMIEALSLGVLEGLILVGTDNALRRDVAVMIHNSLDIPTMITTVDADIISYVIMDGENGKDLVTFRTMQSK